MCSLFFFFLFLESSHLGQQAAPGKEIIQHITHMKQHSLLFLKGMSKYTISCVFRCTLMGGA